MINSGGIFIFGNESNESRIQSFEKMPSFEEMLNSIHKSLLSSVPNFLKKSRWHAIRARTFVRGKRK